MVHHIWQLQAFGPTCWTWWIVKRPSGCVCWPSLPHAYFLSFCLCFLLSNLLSVPIDYQNFLATLGYISYSPQRVFAALTAGGSPALSKQVWSLTKVRGLELVVFQHSRGERREVCVPGTQFLQHAVTSLQLSPSLMLPDRWGCVCMYVVSCILQLGRDRSGGGWGEWEEGWGWRGGEGGGQTTGYG